MVLREPIPLGCGPDLWVRVAPNISCLFPYLSSSLVEPRQAPNTGIRFKTGSALHTLAGRLLLLSYAGSYGCCLAFW